MSVARSASTYRPVGSSRSHDLNRSEVLPYYSTIVWLGLVLALAGVFCATPSVAEQNDAAVHFRSPRTFSVVAPVYVNGHGPYDFLLDTGSTSTAVDKQLRQTLALKRLSSVTVTTVAGNSPVDLAEADTISIGSVTESNVEVLVRDLRGLRDLDPKIRGVLGQNFLSKTDYLLDHRKHTIQWDSSGGLLMSLRGERVPAAVLSGDPANSQMLLHASVQEPLLREFNFILDSGSASVVLFSNSLSASAGPQFSQSFVEDDAGNRRYGPEYNVRLRIGSTYRTIDARVVPLSLKDSPVEGLLPTSSFDSIYVSNKGHFVILQPKQGKQPAGEKPAPDLEKANALPSVTSTDEKHCAF